MFGTPCERTHPVNRRTEAFCAGLGRCWPVVFAGPEEPHAASVSVAVRAADANARRQRGLIVLRTGFIGGFL